jgi:hypothetical protein
MKSDWPKPWSFCISLVSSFGASLRPLLCAEGGGVAVWPWDSCGAESRRAFFADLSAVSGPWVLLDAPPSTGVAERLVDDFNCLEGSTGGSGMRGSCE